MYNVLTLNSISEVGLNKLNPKKYIIGNEMADPDQLVYICQGQFTGPVILGKKRGVIGLGAIGVLVANAAISLGMEVYGYDPFLSVDAAWSLSSEVKRAATKEELVAASD